MWWVSQNIIPFEKFTPPPLTLRVGVDLHLYRVHFLSSILAVLGKNSLQGSNTVDWVTYKCHSGKKVKCFSYVKP